MNGSAASAGFNITRCAFTRCGAADTGGALHAANLHLRLEDCAFEGNTAAVQVIKSLASVGIISDVLCIC